MKPLNFIYRIVHKKGDGYYMYYLQEENDTFYFISNHPAIFFVSNLNELEKKSKLYEDAIKLPIINYEDIKTYTSENIKPITYPPLIEYPL